ncbi:transposase [Halorubrum ezzemoulense]|uniref:transposase n=1 Tax=Halorubrum ezzemoulense TaxID=337243 RepID=UPI00232F7064|nr:transposase [Halorubrum ezzemoulense]MDB2246151.1 transposase [Halorubrum ezzemoulense]MDB2279798.1 transposase [Halorubrum ezzemoulense]MDB2290224.1 transposase [Halorubrum ezzemoulense]MDB2297614.1 transposase [Halorubrum ezzemoulense]MDB2301068.1 transposase [Halorubrum ezzemoulense]
MTSQEHRLTDAYLVGLTLTEALKVDQSLCTALRTLEGPFDSLNDGYPEWHPAPHSFEGMVRLLLYRELTGESYRSLAQYPELAVVFDLEKIPDESVLSRTWRNRFDEATREFVTTAAHYVIKEVHDRDISAPEVRPKAEIVDDEQEAADPVEDKSFSQEEIIQTTRLARDHAFGHFDSGRASNASYEDTQFFELQTFMGMVHCGTAQGATRFQYRHGEEYSPHGDTHLRAVKQFDPEELVNGFNETTDRLLSVIASEASFRRPVTATIDITTIPYYGEVEGMPMVSGTKDRDGRAFKFATLSIIGQNIPLVLAVEPVRESSEWDENPSNQIHRTVRRLVRRAKEQVPIETVLCDREFDSIQVFQTLSNLDVNYLIPKRVSSSERDVLEQMEGDDQEVAVESASIHVESGSHPMRLLYVPSTSGEGTAVFATNLRVGPEEAETFCQRYSRRWQIESEYKSIKGDFLAKTSSKDYRIRLFYFVFAVLLYNIWRLTDFLLKASVGGEMDYAPVITAGECVELVASSLIPHD